MAALTSLPFLRADERQDPPVWLAERRSWRWSDGRPAELRERYRLLCADLEAFSLLPGSARVRQGLRLPLNAGPFRFILQGVVEAEFLSSELGEAQRHLQARFELPGGWSLCWRLIAGHDLATGAVRLQSLTWLQGGEGQGFRHVIAARALRRGLVRAFSPEAMELGYGPSSTIATNEPFHA
jgi:hypothetical protein